MPPEPTALFFTEEGDIEIPLPELSTDVRAQGGYLLRTEMGTQWVPRKFPKGTVRAGTLTPSDLSYNKEFPGWKHSLVILTVDGMKIY